jgi:uncharacterized coiled-coil protein SlyX
MVVDFPGLMQAYHEGEMLGKMANQDEAIEYQNQVILEQRAEIERLQAKVNKIQDQFLLAISQRNAWRTIGRELRDKFMPGVDLNARLDLETEAEYAEISKK